MLAQTNLQLYRQLAGAGWSADALAATRGAYDLARQLFSQFYRPTHKPLLCHTVGSASAAARWGAGLPVVQVALLHPTYYFGAFEDGERGPTPRRRRYVRSVIGTEAEEMLAQYSEAAAEGSIDNDHPGVAFARLADRLDELYDGEALYSPQKRQDGLLDDPAARRRMLDTAQRIVGPLAVADLEEALQRCDATILDDRVTTDDRGSVFQPAGVPKLRRSRFARRWNRYATRVRAAPPWRRAA